MAEIANGTILVVDDNEAGLYAKRRLLENAGFRVLEARTGTAGLEVAMEQRPDLALLDIKLPDIDGFEVCRRLRADGRTASMAIVHITASFERPEDHVRGLEAGADTFLLAPTDPSIVVATARALIRMRRAENALRESDRRKDEFLAVLAHELRNPLAPLLNSVELLERQPDLGGMSEAALRIMRRQISQMVRLIDDLLEISRINENKLELRQEYTTVASIVDAAMETSHSLVEAAGHRIEVRLPAQPVIVYGDVVRLSQIVGNLISNSAKYMDAGGDIGVEAVERGEWVEISVTDTGIGISAEEMPHIFEMFSQARRSVSAQAGGLGIGLALVRRLAELHGGTVRAESGGTGQGSRFTVRLPSPQVRVSNVQPHGGSQAPVIQWKRVLVADDNADAAESLALLLRGLGSEVVIARDGVEAVERAREFQPELVLMDVDMPRMSGLDAAEAMRTQPWGKSVVICAVTGYGQKSDRLKSRAAGIDHHLVKPIDVTVLTEIVARVA